MTKVSDLSVVDIEFLQAVKNINKDPSKYNKTGNSELPANTASIKRATDLTDEQVSYRMGGNSNSKGFEKGDKNLIISYSSHMDGSTLGPRSAELTPHGVNMLDKAEKRMSRFAGVSREEFDRLEKEVEINRKRDALTSRVYNEFETSYLRSGYDVDLPEYLRPLLVFKNVTVDLIVGIYIIDETNDIHVLVGNAEDTITWDDNPPFYEKIDRIIETINQLM